MRPAAPCRVVHLITGLGLGGAEVTLHKLLSGMDSSFDSHVVSLTGSGLIGERLQDMGIPVTSLGMPRGRPQVGALLKMRRMLRHLKPDILQTWMYHADLLGLAAGAGMGIPVVWNIRHSRLTSHGSGRLTRSVARACALLSSRPAAIIVGSHAARDSHAALGYDTRAMVSIPNGFDLDCFRPDPEASASVRAELGIPMGAKLVGMIGRLHIDKGHDVFARVIQELMQAHPAAHFLVAGLDVGESAGPYQPLRAAAGWERVHLLGQREDVNHLLAALDVLVSASTTEGFPNVLCEAMASGVTCVATDVGDSRRIVEPWGRVVAPGNVEALVRAVSGMLTLNQSEREEIGIQARRSIADRFSIDVVIRAYEQLYLCVMSRGRP